MYLLVPIFNKRSCSCNWIWNASLLELTLPACQEGKEFLRCGKIFQIIQLHYLQEIDTDTEPVMLQSTAILHLCCAHGFLGMNFETNTSKCPDMLDININRSNQVKFLFKECLWQWPSSH